MPTTAVASCALTIACTGRHTGQDLSQSGRTRKSPPPTLPAPAMRRIVYLLIVFKQIYRMRTLLLQLMHTLVKQRTPTARALEMQQIIKTLTFGGT